MLLIAKIIALVLTIILFVLPMASIFTGYFSSIDFWIIYLSIILLALFLIKYIKNHK